MAVKPKNKLSKNLIHFRKLHGYKQFQLAEILDIPRERYAKYENNTNPPIEILYKLADIYEISFDTLAGRTQYVSYNIDPNNLQFSDIAPAVTAEQSPEVAEILKKIEGLTPQQKRKVYEAIINKIECD